MRRVGVAAAALVLATAMTAGCNRDNRAAENNGATVGTSGKAANGVSRSDQNFLHDVAVMNAADLELGRLAGERASTAEVKQFAQMMVTDHTQADSKLQTVASQRGVEAAPGLDDKHRDLRDKLAGKQGLDFDKAYADAMVDEHQSLVDKLESRIDKDTLSKAKVDNNNGTDAKIKATAVTPEKSDDANTQAINQFAADLYPVAYAHLQAAKSLRDGVKKRATD